MYIYTYIRYDSAPCNGADSLRPRCIRTASTHLVRRSTRSVRFRAHQKPNRRFGKLGQKDAARLFRTVWLAMATAQFIGALPIEYGPRILDSRLQVFIGGWT